MRHTNFAPRLSLVRRTYPQGHHFVDAHGRTCLLRGVNLSGSTKLPFEPRLPTHDTDRQRFFAHRSVSFVGRPFPLADADEHLQRLRSWGLLFLRFQITWEAIEHAGPYVGGGLYL